VELQIVIPDVWDFDILWLPIWIPLLQCFMMDCDKLDDTTWLACWLPPLFCYCADHVQLSQAPFSLIYVDWFHTLWFETVL
jgi:hypothetical protein